LIGVNRHERPAHRECTTSPVWRDDNPYKNQYVKAIVL
jgi:hypothetical protein